MTDPRNKRFSILPFGLALAWLVLGGNFSAPARDVSREGVDAKVRDPSREGVDTKRNLDRETGTASPRNLDRETGGTSPRNLDRETGGTSPRNLDRETGGASPRNLDRETGGTSPGNLDREGPGASPRDRDGGSKSATPRDGAAPGGSSKAGAPAPAPKWIVAIAPGKNGTWTEEAWASTPQGMLKQPMLAAAPGNTSRGPASATGENVPQSDQPQHPLGLPGGTDPGAPGLISTAAIVPSRSGSTPLTDAQIAQALYDALVGKPNPRVIITRDGTKVVSRRRCCSCCRCENPTETEKTVGAVAIDVEEDSRLLAPGVKASDKSVDLRACQAACNANFSKPCYENSKEHGCLAKLLEDPRCEGKPVPTPTPATSTTPTPTRTPTPATSQCVLCQLKSQACQSLAATIPTCPDPIPSPAPAPLAPVVEKALAPKAVPDSWERRYMDWLRGSGDPLRTLDEQLMESLKAKAVFPQLAKSVGKDTASRYQAAYEAWDARRLELVIQWAIDHPGPNKTKDAQILDLLRGKRAALSGSIVHLTGRGNDLNADQAAVEDIAEAASFCQEDASIASYHIDRVVTTMALTAMGEEEAARRLWEWAKPGSYTENVELARAESIARKQAQYRDRVVTRLHQEAAKRVIERLLRRKVKAADIPRQCEMSLFRRHFRGLAEAARAGRSQPTEATLSLMHELTTGNACEMTTEQYEEQHILKLAADATEALSCRSLVRDHFRKLNDYRAVPLMPSEPDRKLLAKREAAWKRKEWESRTAALERWQAIVRKVREYQFKRAETTYVWADKIDTNRRRRVLRVVEAVDGAAAVIAREIVDPSSSVQQIIEGTDQGEEARALATRRDSLRSWEEEFKAHIGQRTERRKRFAGYVPRYDARLDELLKRQYDETVREIQENQEFPSIVELDRKLARALSEPYDPAGAPKLPAPPSLSFSPKQIYAEAKALKESWLKEMPGIAEAEAQGGPGLASYLYRRQEFQDKRITDLLKDLEKRLAEISQMVETEKATAAQESVRLGRETEAVEAETHREIRLAQEKVFPAYEAIADKILDGSGLEKAQREGLRDCILLELQNFRTTAERAVEEGAAAELGGLSAYRLVTPSLWKLVNDFSLSLALPVDIGQHKEPDDPAIRRIFDAASMQADVLKRELAAENKRRAETLRPLAFDEIHWDEKSERLDFSKFWSHLARQPRGKYGEATAKRMERLRPLLHAVNWGAYLTSGQTGWENLKEILLDAVNRANGGKWAPVGDRASDVWINPAPSRDYAYLADDAREPRFQIATGDELRERIGWKGADSLPKGGFSSSSDMDENKARQKAHEATYGNPMSLLARIFWHDEGFTLIQEQLGLHVSRLHQCRDMGFRGCMTALGSVANQNLIDWIDVDALAAIDRLTGTTLSEPVPMSEADKQFAKTMGDRLASKLKGLEANVEEIADHGNLLVQPGAKPCAQCKTAAEDERSALGLATMLASLYVWDRQLQFFEWADQINRQVVQRSKFFVGWAMQEIGAAFLSGGLSLLNTAAKIEKLRRLFQAAASLTRWAQAAQRAYESSYFMQGTSVLVMSALGRPPPDWGEINKEAFHGGHLFLVGGVLEKGMHGVLGAVKLARGIKAGTEAAKLGFAGRVGSAMTGYGLGGFGMSLYEGKSASDSLRSGIHMAILAGPQNVLFSKAFARLPILGNSRIAMQLRGMVGHALIDLGVNTAITTSDYYWFDPSLQKHETYTDSLVRMLSMVGPMILRHGPALSREVVMDVTAERARRGEITLSEMRGGFDQWERREILARIERPTDLLPLREKYAKATGKEREALEQQVKEIFRLKKWTRTQGAGAVANFLNGAQLAVPVRVRARLPLELSLELQGPAAPKPATRQALEAVHAESMARLKSLLETTKVGGESLYSLLREPAPGKPSGKERLAKARLGEPLELEFDLRIPDVRVENVPEIERQLTETWRYLQWRVATEAEAKLKARGLKLCAGSFASIPAAKAERSIAGAAADLTRRKIAETLDWVLDFKRSLAASDPQTPPAKPGAGGKEKTPADKMPPEPPKRETASKSGGEEGTSKSSGDALLRGETVTACGAESGRVLIKGKNGMVVIFGNAENAGFLASLEEQIRLVKPNMGYLSFHANEKGEILYRIWDEKRESYVYKTIPTEKILEYLGRDGYFKSLPDKVVYVSACGIGCTSGCSAPEEQAQRRGVRKIASGIKGTAIAPVGSEGIAYHQPANGEPPTLYVWVQGADGKVLPKNKAYVRVRYANGRMEESFLEDPTHELYRPEGARGKTRVVYEKPPDQILKDVTGECATCSASPTEKSAKGDRSTCSQSIRPELENQLFDGLFLLGPPPEMENGELSPSATRKYEPWMIDEMRTRYATFRNKLKALAEGKSGEPVTIDDLLALHGGVDGAPDMRSRAEQEVWPGRGMFPIPPADLPAFRAGNPNLVIMEMPNSLSNGKVGVAITYMKGNDVPHYVRTTLLPRINAGPPKGASKVQIAEWAAEIYHDAITCHPWTNGNRRAVTMLMNSLLEAHGLTPSIPPDPGTFHKAGNAATRGVEIARGLENYEAWREQFRKASACAETAPESSLLRGPAGEEAKENEKTKGSEKSTAPGAKTEPPSATPPRPPEASFLENLLQRAAESIRPKPELVEPASPLTQKAPACPAPEESTGVCGSGCMARRNAHDATEQEMIEWASLLYPQGGASAGSDILVFRGGALEGNHERIGELAKSMAARKRAGAAFALFGVHGEAGSVLIYRPKEGTSIILPATEIAIRLGQKAGFQKADLVFLFVCSGGLAAEGSLHGKAVRVSAFAEQVAGSVGKASVGANGTLFAFEKEGKLYLWVADPKTGQILPREKAFSIFEPESESDGKGGLRQRSRPFNPDELRKYFDDVEITSLPPDREKASPKTCSACTAADSLPDLVKSSPAAAREAIGGLFDERPPLTKELASFVSSGSPAVDAFMKADLPGGKIQAAFDRWVGGWKAKLKTTAITPDEEMVLRELASFWVRQSAGLLASHPEWTAAEKAAVFRACGEEIRDRTTVRNFKPGTIWDMQFSEGDHVFLFAGPTHRLVIVKDDIRPDLPALARPNAGKVYAGPFNQLYAPKDYHLKWLPNPQAESLREAKALPGNCHGLKGEAPSAGAEETPSQKPVPETEDRLKLRSQLQSDKTLGGRVAAAVDQATGSKKLPKGDPLLQRPPEISPADPKDDAIRGLYDTMLFLRANQRLRQAELAPVAPPAPVDTLVLAVHVLDAYDAAAARYIEKNHPKAPVIVLVEEDFPATPKLQQLAKSLTDPKASPPGGGLVYAPQGQILPGGGGTKTIDVEASRVVLIGGYADLCLRKAAQQYIDSTSGNLTLIVPLDQIYYRDRTMASTRTESLPPSERASFLGELADKLLPAGARHTGGTFPESTYEYRGRTLTVRFESAPK